MTAKEHNKLIGIFLLAHGGLYALILGFVCIVYIVMGGAIFATAKDEEKFVGVIFIFVVVLLILITLVFTLPQIIGGFKMLKERPNARIWGIIGSIIACLSFPLGTAAGVYGLWFLFGDVGKQFYLGGGNPNTFQNQPPPPPSSWR